MTSPQLRVVRVPLPVDQIRRMDELLVEGAGGFHSRAEFIREAVENLIIDVQYEPAPPEPTAVAEAPTAQRLEATSRGRDQPEDSVPIDRPGSARSPSSPPGFAFTELTAPAGAEATLDQGDAEPAEGPLFGMHNRDYPSLWAAYQLAEIAKDAPIEYGEFARRLLKRAWDFGERVGELEAVVGAPMKITALFPTNREKPQTAEEAFLAFAVGEPGRGGPLLDWRVCQSRRENSDAIVGLTTAGYGLLQALEGLSLRLPHRADHAETFLAHLQEHAPGDWGGFATTLATVGDEPTRAELLGRFAELYPGWTDNQIATNAAGYIARCREWGLVEMKQRDHRYHLTNLGEQILSEGERQ